MKNALLIIIFSFVFSFDYGQDITGAWHGVGIFSEEALRFSLHVNKKDGGYSATLDSPDLDAYGMRIDTIVFFDNELRFTFGEQTYRGHFSNTTRTFEGSWYHPGGIEPLNFGRTPIDPPKGSMAYIRSEYDREEKYIAMRDKSKLFTSIYSPKDRSEKHPIVLVRTPYNIEPRENFYSKRLLGLIHLIEEHYIIVFQDVRGRYMSEGNFVDVRPYNPDKKKKKDIDENSDTFDTIDWLVKNVANNNGKVGVFGISYPGFYSTMSLPNAHPALKAVSPQAPVTDWFIGDDWHRNGAFMLMDAFSFYSSVGRPRPQPTRRGPSPFQYHSEDNYDFYLKIGAIKNVRQKYFGDTIQFWSDLMTHPDYDEFWKARNPLPYLTEIKPAVLVVGGWFDAEDMYGPLKTYEAIESQNPGASNRLVMGPWYHGQWASRHGDHLGNVHFGSNTSAYFKELERKFFNYYLKGEGTMDLPEASIFVTGTNEWRAFDTWPPKNTEQRSFYFQRNGQLSNDLPPDDSSFDEYVSDPNKPVPYTEDVHLGRTREYLTDDQRFAARRPDVLVYTSTELTDNVTVTGPLNVELYVSTTGTDADFVVKLIDVFPDEVPDYPENEKHVPMGGYQMLVRGDVFRGRYRNSFEKPEPFEPEAVTKVSFELQDVAHTFQKGHKIMIQVQSSWFPLVDRNPQQFVNIYQCSDTDFVKATHRVYHNRIQPSRVSLQVLRP